MEYFAKVTSDDERTRRAFAERLAGQSGFVRESAVRCFTKVAADDEPTVYAGTERLVDEDEAVRLSAVEHLTNTTRLRGAPH